VDVEVYFLDANEVVRFINDELVKSQEVRIAVAFVNLNGLKKINLEKVDKAKIVVGASISQGATEYRALGKLEQLARTNKKVKVRVIDNPKFHPKLFIFKRNSYNTVIVGSSNLTEGGLQDNWEANLAIRFKRDNRESKEIESFFDRVFYAAEPLTRKFIENYRKAYNKSTTKKPIIRFNRMPVEETPLPDYELVEKILEKNYQRLKQIKKRLYQDFNDAIVDRKKAEAKARKLIQRYRGRITKEMLKEILKYLDTSFHSDGEKKLIRWGQALKGQNLKLILQNNINDLNDLIKQLYFDENYRVIDEVKLKGVGPVFTTLFLYLKDPERYSVLVPSAEKNVFRLFPKSVRGVTNFARYHLFNYYAQTIRKKMNIDPRILDIYLLWI
jgi:HKD family nuclease